jgi:hypothetical protein
MQEKVIQIVFSVGPEETIFLMRPALLREEIKAKTEFKLKYKVSLGLSILRNSS